MSAATDSSEIWSALVSVYQGVLHDVVTQLGEHAAMDSGVFSVLAYLDRAEPRHRLAMGALQQLMYPRYSQPGFSRLVQRMEADGLVERRPDPRDGRAVILVSTRAGRRAHDRANGVYAASVHEYFGRHMGRKEGARLAEVLNRVRERRITT